MSQWLTLLIAIAVWMVAVVILRWIAFRLVAAGPDRDPVAGVMWLVVRAHSRFMNRLTCEGLAHRPDTNKPGGLVVVSNHSSPVDPLLIQAVCRFRIRWMMAADMMIPQLDVLWRWQRIIAVARDGRDSGPAREAIRHVRGGGVVGIFPEGGLPRPQGEIRPFHNGVGLIVARTGAPVLLVWTSETPEPGNMITALLTPSRARLVFVDLLDFSGERDPATITATLRRRLADVSGWPTNDEPLIPHRPLAVDPFAVT